MFLYFYRRFNISLTLPENGIGTADSAGRDEEVDWADPETEFTFWLGDRMLLELGEKIELGGLTLVVFDAKFELGGLMLVELDDKFEPGGLMLVELDDKFEVEDWTCPGGRIWLVEFEAKFWFGRTLFELVEDGLTVVPNGRVPGKRRYDNEH